MPAELGAQGSSHSSQLCDPPPVEPAADGAATVIRRPQPVVTTVAQDGELNPQLRVLFSPDPAHDVGGIRIAHFVIQSRIGVGGMGSVFRAFDTRLNRDVALKVLSPQATSDEQLVLRFHNEARAAARLNHDNIARVFFSGDEHGAHFIAYELVEGINLRDLIARRGALPVIDAVNYSLQIALALAHMSAAGVIHRDIKPSNIIITPDDRAHVVDLGLARKDGEDTYGDLTVAGTTLGTFDYISPEQAQDPRTVDVRSDIYSLGCTLYHMLTGHPPYPEGTALQKLLDHHAKEPPDPAEINRRVPAALSVVVQCMMASDPHARYATPTELINELMEVADRIGLQGLHPDGMIWKTARQARVPFVQAHLGWVVMAVLLLMGGIYMRLEPRSLTVLPPLGASVDSAEGAAPPVGDARPDPSVQGTELFNAVVDTLWPLNATSPATADADTATAPDSGEGEHRLFGEIDWLSTAGMRGLVSEIREAMASDSGTDSSERSADGTTAAITSTDGTANAEATDNRGLVSIRLQSDPDNDFKTIEAACWAARDGDVIVVRGGRPMLEKPLRIVNKSLTIRGEPDAAGQLPLIRFDGGTDPAANDGRMMSFVNGSLTLTSVDVQVIVRDEIAVDRWALCALTGADRARFRGVNVDFINPRSQPAAVFEVSMGADAAFARMKNDGGAGEYEVRLSDTFVRGACHLFAVESALAGTLELNQSAVSLEAAMLAIRGTSSMAADDRAAVELRMDHATCLLADGLVHMTDFDVDGGGPQRELLPLSILSENSIFATRSPTPLVSMEGTSVSRELLMWAGNKNLYDGFDVFWLVDASLAALDIEEIGFASWLDIWMTTTDAAEVGAEVGPVPWRTSLSRTREVSRTRVSELALDDSDPGRVAIQAATDGTNLGVDITRLRRIPDYFE